MAPARGQNGEPAAPMPRKRRQGERVPAHVLVRHPLNAGVCEYCGLAERDDCHFRPVAKRGEVVRDDKGRWVKGTPSPSLGRPTGDSETTKAVREMCQRIVTDPEYCEGLILRARAGLLPPGVEVTIFHYAVGKPPEKIDVTGKAPFSIVFLGHRRDPLADDEQRALGAGDV